MIEICVEQTRLFQCDRFHYAFFVIEIVIEFFSARSEKFWLKSVKKISNRTNTAIFYVTSSTVQKIGRAAQADFFWKWVELMNIYVTRVLCMT